MGASDRAGQEAHIPGPRSDSAARAASPRLPGQRQTCGCPLIFAALVRLCPRSGCSTALALGPGHFHRIVRRLPGRWNRIGASFRPARTTGPPLVAVDGAQQLGQLWPARRWPGSSSSGAWAAPFDVGGYVPWLPCPSPQHDTRCRAPSGGPARPRICVPFRDFQDHDNSSTGSMSLILRRPARAAGFFDIAVRARGGCRPYRLAARQPVTRHGFQGVAVADTGLQLLDLAGLIGPFRWLLQLRRVSVGPRILQPNIG